jgi:hypothetical protein
MKPWYKIDFAIINTAAKANKLWRWGSGACCPLTSPSTQEDDRDAKPGSGLFFIEKLREIIDQSSIGDWWIARRAFIDPVFHVIAPFPKSNSRGHATEDISTWNKWVYGFLNERVKL